MTHKSCLQVPTPAVVEKTNQHGSQEVTNQQGDVGCHGVRYDQPDKLLGGMKHNKGYNIFIHVKYYVMDSLKERKKVFLSC